jgi:SMC interacting uncharacterized protein involved in chromosome segregation
MPDTQHTTPMTEMWEKVQEAVDAVALFVPQHTAGWENEARKALDSLRASFERQAQELEAARQLLDEKTYERMSDAIKERYGQMEEERDEARAKVERLAQELREVTEGHDALVEYRDDLRAKVEKQEAALRAHHAKLPDPHGIHAGTPCAVCGLALAALGDNEGEEG